MSDNNNPFGGQFGGNSGQYTTSVQFGGAEPAKAVPGAAPAGGDLIKDTTTAAFATDVIQESRKQPVLVDFWAPWCGPCKQLTPQLEKAVKAAGGKVKLVKMNIDDHPSIAGQLGIQSIPAVIAFKDGQPVDGFMGAIPESQIGEFITKVGGKGNGAPPVAEALARQLKRMRRAMRRPQPTSMTPYWRRRRRRSRRSPGWASFCSRPATAKAPRRCWQRRRRPRRMRLHLPRCAPR